MYIYGLKHPNYFQPRYVGFTSCSLYGRLRRHLKDKEINHRTNWIKSLAKENLKPDIFIIEEVNKENWKEREIYWIKHLRDCGYKLVNSTNGGDGPLGYKHTAEAMKKIIEHNRNKSTETKRKMSLAKMGTKFHLGYKHSEETKNKWSEKRRTISDDEILKIFELIKSMSQNKISKIIKCNQVTIHNILKRKLNYIKNSKFDYLYK